MNNNNDSQIVKRIQAGDSSAFAELVKKQAAFPEIELLEMHKQLQGIGWLRAKEEREPISLVWRHDLYRESIYNSIEPNVRRQLHAEIAHSHKQQRVIWMTPSPLFNTRFNLQNHWKIMNLLQI